MRFLIVGFGSIAKRHLRLLKAMDASFEVAVLRQKTLSADLGEFQPLVARVFMSEADGLAWRPDAVLVTNPSPFHVATALRFAEAGCHLFVEKPVSDDLEGLAALERVVVQKKLVFQVGYVLRFMKAFVTIKAFIEGGHLGKAFSLRASVGQDLRTWRTGKDHKQGVTALPELGGGVVLELSHELDYALWFLGEVERVQAFTATVGGLGVAVEDVAEVQLTFKCGAVANIHLDMIDHARERSCRIIGEKGTLVWSLEDPRKVRFFDAATREWVFLGDGDAEHEDMFKAQLKHFLDCVATGRSPRVSMGEGRRALELALAVKRAAAERREVLL